MVLTTGEADEVGRPTAGSSRSAPAGRAAVEEDAFALVPSCGAPPGSACARCCEWGAVDEAVRYAASRSSVRRCRGLYRLGVLPRRDRRADVLARLDDRDFAVRRTACWPWARSPTGRGRGQLARAAVEPRLRRDFLSSVDRIGAAAVPVLRAGLTRSLGRTAEAAPTGARRGFLAAEALGLVGAVSAVPALEAALEQSSVELKFACIHALGQLGASSSVVALAGPLGHPDPDVRRAAAQSLGLIGGAWAVPALTDVLHDDNVEVARAAANALHRCGPPAATCSGRAPPRWRARSSPWPRWAVGVTARTDAAGLSAGMSWAGSASSSTPCSSTPASCSSPGWRSPTCWPTGGGSTSRGTTSGSGTRTRAASRC